MGKIEAVIFDWAGTTVDYGCFAPVCAFQEAFQEFGIEPNIAEVREPMGMLKRAHIQTMLGMERINGLWQEAHKREWTDQDVEQIYQAFEKKLFEVLERYAVPNPYVLDKVAELKSRGIKIGSTTGYTDKMMAVVVPKAKAYGYEPDAWFSPDAVGGIGRPYPYMVFRNMERLGIKDVSQVVKVGDTVADILEGKHAGVKTIGIIEGSSVLGLTQEEYQALEDPQAEIRRVTETYLEAGADQVILNMSELHI